MSSDDRHSANQASKYLLLSVTSFAVVNLSVKSLSHIHFTEVVFFRALISLILCYFGLRHQRISWLGGNKPLLIARGVAGTVALTLFFFVLQRLPLATAVTLQYLSPIFTVIWAHLIFKERGHWIQWMFFIGGFVGVWMIQGFDPQVSSWLAVVGVISAMASGLAYTFVRRLKATEHELVIIFYFPMITLPVMFPFVIMNWVTPSWKDAGLLVLIGIFTQLGQLYLTRGYGLRKAADVGLVNYIGVIYAVALGWIFFGEVIPWRSGMGIALILFCVSLGSVWAQWEGRRQRRLNLT